VEQDGSNAKKRKDNDDQIVIVSKYDNIININTQLSLNIYFYCFIKVFQVILVKIKAFIKL